MFSQKPVLSMRGRLLALTISRYRPFAFILIFLKELPTRVAMDSRSVDSYTFVGRIFA